MASSNLDRLVEARVVASTDVLSDAERTVIDGLSDQEVQTLISIRQKLAGAVDSPAASLADEDPLLDLKPNVVL